jgi:hypothetical protein
LVSPTGVYCQDSTNSRTEEYLDPKDNNDFILINDYLGAGQERIEPETVASDNAGDNHLAELKFGPMRSSGQ